MLSTRCVTISIHVPLAGDDQVGERHQHRQGISIHVPLAGDDADDLRAAADEADFYPRPPCGGRLWPLMRRAWSFVISIHVPLAGDDDDNSTMSISNYIFLSTSPLRGTTGKSDNGKTDAGKISIHVPLAGDDLPSRAYVWLHLLFLSTSPLRGTTFVCLLHQL